jgi:arabinofuranosyltransferase
MKAADTLWHRPGARADAEAVASVAGPKAGRLVLTVAVVIYVLVVIQNAWLSDDAFVAFRAAANLTNGHGLVSNPGERVQAFTSPLWTLAFAAIYVVVHNAYAVALLLSLTCSVAAVLIFLRSVDAPAGPRAFAVLALACSMAYVHYSTSGLENPLAHLLLAVFFACYVNRTLGGLFLASSLLLLTRLDLILLVGPALVHACWGRPWRQWLKAAALGSLPMAVWELLSLVYYGFLFPNTAYAKLNTTLPFHEVVGQGLTYLVDSATRDPVTLLVIAMGLAAPLIAGRRALPLTLGIALYVTYVVRVGGDFMSGRFLTAPFLVSVMVVTHFVLARVQLREQVAAAAVVAVVAGLSAGLPLKSTTPSCVVPATGIVDERGCYVAHTGLLENLREQRYKQHKYFAQGKEWRAKDEKVVVSTLVGLAGFAAGPDVHIIDPYALSDPLLARLPFPGETKWRVGHLRRDLPEGYELTVKSGENRLANPHLARYYDRLSAIVHRPLLSRARWSAIVRMNLGLDDALLDKPVPSPTSESAKPAPLSAR